MATDEGDSPEQPELEGETETPAGADAGVPAVVGEYTWDDFLREHGYDDAADRLYERFDAAPGSDRWGEETDAELTREDWERSGVDPAEFLGFPPWELPRRLAVASDVAGHFVDYSPLIGYDETPVVKDIYGWEDYKREYFYGDDGTPPTGSDGEPEAFDPSDTLGFDPEQTESVLSGVAGVAEEIHDLVEERTVDVDEEIDEDAFFTDAAGNTTLANRYDLEKAVPQQKKLHFREEDRYWVNEPYAFVVIFHSVKENEKKYYVVEPHKTEIEVELTEFLTDKLRSAIKYDDEGTAAGEVDHREAVIEDQTLALLERYDLYDADTYGASAGLGNRVAKELGIDPEAGDLGSKLVRVLGYVPPELQDDAVHGIAARPEPAVVAEDANTLTEYQVEKLLYYLTRDFIGYERIDGIKHDINVEDISCDGYDSPVFVYHSDHEQIISNVYHGRDELDDFVVKLAQRSGKGISKRRPQVDATLPDGSRAQLTLGKEVSAHGTNYTIRQFQEVPHTPIDLINWNTFSLDQMAFLWLCIENDKSLIFAGGTASGKTTSLNAVSLFIPSNGKIVSIEDTREVELPQRNWIASVTRPSFSDDDKGDIDEFELLEAALRQRPDYIVMGEVRGEEGRTLFQVMSTGHTTYTTFHADNVGEVLKRFTTDPINVSKTMFTALDLVSVQTATRVQGRKVRRNKSLTEINHYEAENDEINVQDVYQWQAETDEFLKMGDSSTLEQIKFDRGWTQARLDSELFKRRVVLAYLIYNRLNTYTQVAATLQAFINDPETILALMANDDLERSLEDLREMESVLIDVDPEKEEMVPRPDPGEAILKECREILDRAEEELFADYYGETPDDVAEALVDAIPEADVDPTEPAGELPEEFADVDLGPEQSEGAEAAGDVADDRDALTADEGDEELTAGDDEVPELLGGTDDEGAEADARAADDGAAGDVAGGDDGAAGDVAGGDDVAADDGTTEDIGAVGDDDVVAGADAAAGDATADDLAADDTADDLAADDTAADDDELGDDGATVADGDDGADADGAFANGGEDDDGIEDDGDDDFDDAFDLDDDDVDEWGFGEVEDDE